MDQMEVIGLIASLIQAGLIIAVTLLLIWMVRWAAAGRWRRLMALFDRTAVARSDMRPATPRPTLRCGKRSGSMKFDLRPLIEQTLIVTTWGRCKRDDEDEDD